MHRILSLTGRRPIFGEMLVSTPREEPMGIERLNSAVWAAGFAMAPTEDDALETTPVSRSSVESTEPASWQSATSPRKSEPEVASSGGIRQWIAGLQRRATA